MAAGSPSHKTRPIHYISSKAMSVADYSQRAEDHQRLLVLVKPLMQLKTKFYARIIDRVTSVTYIQLPDSKRSMWIRYRQHMHLENNDWGDFQVHRRVAGVICLGKATCDIELATVYSNFETLKQTYRYTLFDARCFLFGMTQAEAEKTASGARPDVIYYSGLDNCEQLEDHVKDFLSSLFWVLESKRLDRKNDKSDRLPLLMAPFERKDMVGIDTETRTFKRKVQGRMRKHLADLHLLACLTQEAFVHYQSALEILRGANDWLWMGACWEGMCAASVIQLYPPKPKTGIPRNASFSGGNSLIGGRVHRSESFDLANGLPDFVSEERPKNCLLADDIVEKYKEAISHYSKYTNAGIVEMEACIKATQVLVQQKACYCNHKKTLEAADFLQNVIYINVNLSDQEKVERYSALSRLFTLIGFHRKAAFFKRVAAMQCVTPQNQHPAWNMCNQLLMEAIKGYKLTLDPREYPTDQPCGWPLLQTRILHELVFSARRMGEYGLAVRILSFMLHVLHDQLSTTEKREIAINLGTLTNKVAGVPHPIARENGTIIPAVPFTRFPTVKAFRLVPLSRQLTPLLQKSSLSTSPSSESLGPFIYSPIQNRVCKDKKLKPRVDFKWVAEDVCEMCLNFYNPLPFELRVSNLGFLTEGLNFDPIPATVTLPAESGPHTVSIMGTPKGAGILTIVGYTTNVLGVENHCRFKHISTVPQSYYEVAVVPALPLLRVKTSLPQAVSTLSLDPAESKTNTSAAVSLFQGESCECGVTLINGGKVPVEFLSLKLNSESGVLADKVFSWSEENIRTQLPLQPGGQMMFTLYIKATGSFIAKHKNNSNDIPVTPTPSRTFEYSTPKSTPKRSASSTFLETCKPDSGESVEPDSLQRTVESTLKISYTGGPGMEEDFHREASVLLRVDIKPSVVFTQWSAIPATDSKEFHLVLDTLNATSQELDVQYGDQASLVLGSQQNKRLAVKLKRFVVAQPRKPTLNGFTECDMRPSGGGSVPQIADVQSQSSELPGTDTQAGLGSLYAQQLATMVDIRWTCPALKKSGLATLDHLELSPSMLDHVRTCPIHWQVCLEDRLVNTDSQASFPAGQPLSVEVTITNNMDEATGRLQLLVEPYIDHQNGTREVNPQDKVVCSGSCSINSDKLEAEQSLTHTSSFIFLFPGLYKFNITCTEMEPSQLDQAPVVAPIIIEEDTIFTKREGQSWKYRPALEVMIT
ncbi:trafficking protein particle complex subunit 9-like isoform X2 [Acanthaster planci]|uniref:Trafficking protein particle complex subunit 9-like isoform X2 n=1 Tax=Acanthaster planci TaxID=133434 RepID=A0A8B7ZI01_ACAPL|nr:trafficking protein particle complex subunit 9-like isoform X2 [Acanthaster planci]